MDLMLIVNMIVNMQHFEILCCITLNMSLV